MVVELSLAVLVGAVFSKSLGRVVSKGAVFFKALNGSEDEYGARFTAGCLLSIFCSLSALSNTLVFHRAKPVRNIEVGLLYLCAPAYICLVYVIQVVFSPSFAWLPRVLSVSLCTFWLSYVLVPQRIVSVLGKKMVKLCSTVFVLREILFEYEQKANTAAPNRGAYVCIFSPSWTLSMTSSNGMDFPPFLAHSDVQSLVFGHENP